MADGYEETAEQLETLALGSSRRGGRSGRGGGGGQDREVLISKALSSLLRHQAGNAGVDLDSEGYAKLDRVLLWPRIRSLKPTFAEIQSVVKDNAKQRFSMKPVAGPDEDPDSINPADWVIRANQGHSLKLESKGLHTPVTLEAGNIPDVVVHGTYFAFWPRIIESGGLKRMSRTHVHFGTGLPEDGSGQPSSKVGATAATDSQVHGAGDEQAAEGIDIAIGQPEPQIQREGGRQKVISGMRSDAEVLIFVDVARSLEDGELKWWLSSNGVMLTEGNADGLVPVKYFKEVRGRRQGVGELWRNGEKVADLPPTLKVTAPPGKGGRGRGGRGGRGGSGRGSGRGGGGRGRGG
ncbi:KptA family-domain-containing protein [Xylariales sp. PMI_506]|nr:KptA family-domain-containing protein [Xylariales sp. PMI_506]